jgi:translation initiation factor 3 subunit H
LKIIKHCRESYPNDVTGQLLGLDDKSVLEVTNCFPFPSDGDEDTSGKKKIRWILFCYLTANKTE